MKILALCIVAGLIGTGYWFFRPATLPDPVAVRLSGSLPSQTPLSATPRSRFTPTTRKGYYNIDAVDDFTLPATKSITFCGAGRNLHVQQDRTKLFRRGFSSVDLGRMVPNVEFWRDGFPAKGWQSPLAQRQRAWVVYRDYFEDSFGLAWAKDGNKGPETLYRAASPRPGEKLNRNTLYQASMELSGGCIRFGDCPPNGMKSTYGLIFLDIENDDDAVHSKQEQANLYTFMMKTIRENSSPQTLLGSVNPIPHNSFGFSRASDYTAGLYWLWDMPVRHTATSRQRGMPDELVGKSYGDYADFQMPGTYYLYPEFDYSIDHTGNNDRHWLAAVLEEQEVNRKLTLKKRIAWQWLFNLQNSEFNKSAKADNPAPPAVAEGTAVFYWFTGAYGVLFWDDQIDLTPDQPSPTDPNLKGLGNDRNYACYEHYIHGLWRLFKHHGDLFNGQETYLNEATECSYDGGQTWYQYNANQIKTRNLPFVRAIVNGNQILVAASKAYARPDQTNRVMLRYVQNGYTFYTAIMLKGDEIYLGRASMSRGNN